MSASESYLLIKLNKAISDNRANEVQYYYEIIRDIKMQQQLENDLHRLTETMKQAKIYLIDKLPGQEQISSSPTA